MVDEDVEIVVHEENAIGKNRGSVQQDWFGGTAGMKIENECKWLIPPSIVKQPLCVFEGNEEKMFLLLALFLKAKKQQ